MYNPFFTQITMLIAVTATSSYIISTIMSQTQVIFTSVQHEQHFQHRDVQSEFLNFAAMIFWHFLFFWNWLIAYFLYRIWYMTNSSYFQASLILLVVAYTSYLIFDKTFSKGGMESERFLDSFIVRNAGEWFPIRIIKTEELTSERQYVFAVHPHGMMPWSLFPFGRTPEWREKFPGISIRSIAADAVFHIPISREASILSGGISASRESCTKALVQGNSLAILVGGSCELLENDCHDTKDILVLKERRGFVRLALENGVDLVPCYCFGASELYGQFHSFKRFRKWFLKKTKFVIAFGWGQSFFNLLPKRRPLYLVIGAPIRVEKVANPSEQEVDRLHEQYVAKLKKLFVEWKYKLNYQRELVIT